MPAAYLETARLKLRPLSQADIPAIVQGIGNYDVVRWLSSVPYPYSDDNARWFLGSNLAAPGVCWGIEDDSGLQGAMSIKDELGFWLARNAWGKGYVTEAGDAVIDACFADPTLSALKSSYFLGNDRSKNALTKLGFVTQRMAKRDSVALNQEVAAAETSLDRARWTARRCYDVTTSRLTLRALRMDDLGDLRRIAGDIRVARNLFSVTNPWPEDEARRWLLGSQYRGRPGFRAAILRRGRLIGTVGMGAAPGGGPITTMWFIDPDHWGQGYATEAAAALLADTMDRFGIDTLWADHFADNPASGAVMRKLGFQQTKTGTGTSRARLEPAPVVIYRLDRSQLKAHP